MIAQEHALFHQREIFAGGGASFEQRVRDDVRRALGACHFGPLDRLHVDVHGRCVVLSGAVPTPFHRKRAAEIAAQIAGVNQVRNQLDVDWTDATA